MGAAISHTSKVSLRFTIPNKQESRNLLHISESIDLYLEECRANVINRKSRQTNTYDVFHTNDEDIVSDTLLFNSYIPRIPKRLQTDLGQIHIIYLMPSADGGMPHTRPNNIICMPYSQSRMSISTLIHELWHIHQRYYKESWEGTLRIAWSFVPYDGTIPEYLEVNRRYNPDTINSPYWIWNNEWIPIPVFTDISSPTLQNVDIWFYNNKKKYHSREIPTAMRAFFGDMPKVAYEHPYEMSAYMLSDKDVENSSTPAYEALIQSIGRISVNVSGSNYI